MATWWDRWPARYEKELDALQRAGIDFEVDKVAEREGVRVLRIRMQVGDTHHRLIARYPDLFPFFRPEVYGEDLSLPRHQNPFEKTLCLIGRRSHNWSPSNTLAELLVEKFPEILRVAEDPSSSHAASVEEHQGEPISDYYSPLCLPGSYLLIDSSWTLDREVKSGTFTVRYTVGEIQLEDGHDRTALPRIRGVIESVWSEDNMKLAVWSGEISHEFTKTARCKWARFDEIVDSPMRHARDVRDAIASKSGVIPPRPDVGKRSKSKAEREIVGVVFPEELGWRSEGDGWLFVLSIPRGKIIAPYFIKAFRAGKEDMGIRVPARRALESRHIVVVGLGAVGGSIAVDLARNGATKLSVIDRDAVEPGPTVRWPFGAEYYGRRKVDVVADFVTRNYPGTRVDPHCMSIGAVRDPRDEKSQIALLGKIFEDADLVIDATAEVAVAQYLAWECRERHVPFLTAFAYPGVWGGLVARFCPERDDRGCWLCLQTAIFDTRVIPEPVYEETGEVNIQPAGCADPTFEGAGFDIQEISLEAVRMAVSTLSKDGKYPATSWDAAILSLRNSSGDRIPPHWQEYELKRNPSCPVCGKKKR